MSGSGVCNRTRYPHWSITRSCRDFLLGLPLSHLGKHIFTPKQGGVSCTRYLGASASALGLKKSYRRVEEPVPAYQVQA